MILSPAKIEIRKLMYCGHVCVEASQRFPKMKKFKNILRFKRNTGNSRNSPLLFAPDPVESQLFFWDWIRSEFDDWTDDESFSDTGWVNTTECSEGLFSKCSATLCLRDSPWNMRSNRRFDLFISSDEFDKWSEDNFVFGVFVAWCINVLFECFCGSYGISTSKYDTRL